MKTFLQFLIKLILSPVVLVGYLLAWILAALFVGAYLMYKTVEALS